MKSVLRATAILSSSSIVSIIVGLLSAKAWAMLLGPSGLGFMGLLQGLVGLAGLFGGASLGTGLVRLGANAVAHQDETQIAALHRAIWRLFWIAGTSVALLMVLLRVPISSWMLGSPTHANDVALMALALLCSLASGLYVSLLNVHHQVQALAQYGVANSLLTVALMLPLVWCWREQGIAPGIIASTAAGCALSWWLLRHHVGKPKHPPASQAVRSACRELLRFGLPFTASMLVGTGVQYLLPALVLHTLGASSVGFYRAAVAISVTYLGFLLNTMAMDYYPRVSAMSDQPAELVKLVNQQHRLVLLLAGPMILGLMALAPLLIPLIYSAEFGSSVAILEWQLIGDLLKFSSWTLGFVILARSGSLTVFLVELVAGANILLCSWLGMYWFGLPGLGIGFLVTYCIHYLLVWTLVSRDIRLVWTLENKLLLFGTCSAALIVQLLAVLQLDSLRTPIALAFALLAGCRSLIIIWREWIGDQTRSEQDMALKVGKV